MILKIFAVVGFLVFAGCAQKVKTPAPETPQVAAPRTMGDATKYAKDIAAIDTQLVSLDDQIKQASSKVHSLKAIDVVGKEGKIAEAEKELKGLESQRRTLMSRRQKLQTELLN